jgi:hypothetical protein
VVPCTGGCVALTVTPGAPPVLWRRRGDGRQGRCHPEQSLP